MFAVASCSSEGGKNTAAIQEQTTLLTSKPWRLDVDAIKKRVDASKLSPVQSTIIEQSLDITQFATFEFAADSTVYIDLNNGDPKTRGVWNFDNTANKMYLSLTGGANVQPHEVIKMTKDSVILAGNPKLGLLYDKVFVPLSAGKGLPTRPAAPAKAEEAPTQE